MASIRVEIEKCVCVGGGGGGGREGEVILTFVCIMYNEVLNLEHRSTGLPSPPNTAKNITLCTIFLFFSFL